jgi:hypothetical protein
MKRLAVVIVLIVASTSLSLAQKTEVKDDLITADGADYAKIEKDGCGAFSPQCQYYVSSLKGKRLFVVKHLQFKDPDEMSAANRDGTVHYLQFVFSKSGAKAETPYPATLMLRAKDVARLIVKAHLMKDGELDEEAAQEFVNNNGTPYSDKSKKLGGPDIIIIEK